MIFSISKQKKALYETGQDLLFFFYLTFHINQIVNCGNKERSTDNISQRNGNYIVEKTAPSNRMSFIQKHSDGNEIHIGDTMLETGSDKSHNREKYSPNFTGDVMSGESHPNCKANQPITQDRSEKSGAER